MQFWHILAAKLAFIIIMEVKPAPPVELSLTFLPRAVLDCPTQTFFPDIILKPVVPSSSTACRVCGQVLCGLDDSRCSLWRQGSYKERALPGPGVSPWLRSGEAEDPTQPKRPQWLYVHAHDLPVYTQTRGAVRVSLAQRAAGQSAGHDGRTWWCRFPCLCIIILTPLYCSFLCCLCSKHTQRTLKS